MKITDLREMNRPKLFLLKHAGKFMLCNVYQYIEGQEAIGKLFFVSEDTFVDYGYIDHNYKYAFVDNVLCTIEGYCQHNHSMMYSLVCKVVMI